MSDTHAAALRDAFAPFIINARRAGSGPMAARQRMSMRAGRAREETAAIREWAHANGLGVSTLCGRISSTVLEAYENRGNAHAAPAVAKAPPVEPVAPVAASTAEPAAEAGAEAEVKPKRRTCRKVTAEG